jgi:kinesin family protein 5
MNVDVATCIVVYIDQTHTMEGEIYDPEMQGIVPRSIHAIFDGIGSAEETVEFSIKVSFVEIYLEKIRDLLDGTHTKNNLAIREDKVKGIYIAGCNEEFVASVEELLEIMKFGASNRAKAATSMNAGSSRSHSIFTVVVTQRDTLRNSSKTGKLVLVDLAGSEAVKKPMPWDRGWTKQLQLINLYLRSAMLLTPSLTEIPRMSPIEIPN